MALVIVTIPTVHPSPQLVSPRVVQDQALASGNPSGSRSDVAAVTIPRISVDQRQLRYEQRRAPAGIEFRFQDGTLTLTLSHEIFMSNHLSACEQRIWLEHELDHVRDNEQLMGQMLTRVPNDATIGPILINPQWYPRDSFDLIQQTITAAVGAIFRELTTAAVGRRDTAAEYARIRNKVQAACRGNVRRHTGRGRPTTARESARRH